MAMYNACQGEQVKTQADAGIKPYITFRSIIKKNAFNRSDNLTNTFQGSPDKQSKQFHELLSMKWELRFRWEETAERSTSTGLFCSTQFKRNFLLMLSAKLLPDPDIKEKIGEIWIAGNIILHIDNNPRKRMESVPSKVLKKSNSYQAALSSDESPIKMELNNWQQIVVDVEIILVEHTLDVIEPVSVPPNPMSHDFGALLAFSEEESEEKFCDVKLTISPARQTDETSIFYAHKAVLATRSEVFAKMFAHNMLESATNIIELPDIDSDVLEELLTYIYTGECPNIEELAESLIYHAEKYELDHLKALCEERLSYDLQIDNAARILVLADTCKAEQLKRNALLYVNEHGDEVERTKEWEDVQKSNDILRDLVSTMYQSAAAVKKQKLQ